MVKRRYFTTIAIAIFLIMLLLAYVHISYGQPAYTYYGKVPAKIWQYRPADWQAQPACQNPYDWVVYNSPVTLSLLAIVSGEDGVQVEVYNLTYNQLIAKATLKSLEPLYLLLKNGTVFKVVASKPVTVQLVNYNQTPKFPLPFLPPTVHSFYYSVEGAYVGKEFVFVALQGSLTATDYTILAVEPAEITIERDDRQTISLKLKANEYKYVTLTPFRVYRIKSTGSIMVMSGAIPGIGGYETTSFAIPSVEGGFQGRFFLTRAFKAIEWGWDKVRDYGFRVLSIEDTVVTLYDLETGTKIGDFNVPGGSGVMLRPNAYAVALVSEKPVSFWFMHNGSIEIENAGMHGGWYCGYPRSTMFFTLRPNEDTLVQFPSNASLEVYFYSKEDATVSIDDTMTVKVKADTPYLFTLPGVHKLRSDKELLVQVNSWPRYPEHQGLWFTGTVIPPLEAAGLKPQVEVTIPGAGGGIPLAQIAIVVAAVAIAAGVVLMLRKRVKREG